MSRIIIPGVQQSPPPQLSAFDVRLWAARAHREAEALAEFQGRCRVGDLRKSLRLDAEPTDTVTIRMPA